MSSWDYDVEEGKALTAAMTAATNTQREDILAAIDEFRSWATSAGRHNEALLLATVMAYIRRGDHEGAAARAPTHEETTLDVNHHTRTRVIEAIRFIGLHASCMRHPVADLISALQAARQAPGVALTNAEFIEAQQLADVFDIAVRTLDRMVYLRPVKR